METLNEKYIECQRCKEIVHPSLIVEMIEDRKDHDLKKDDLICVDCQTVVH